MTEADELVVSAQRQTDYINRFVGVWPSISSEYSFSIIRDQIDTQLQACDFPLNSCAIISGYEWIVRSFALNRR